MQQNFSSVSGGGTALFTPETIATVAPSYSRLNICAVKGLSISQIVFGSLSIIIGVILFIIYSDEWFSWVSGGLWGGIWILLTGILGIAAAKDPRNGCLLGTTLAFNIISILVAVVDGIVSLVIIRVLNGCNYQYYFNYYYESYRTSYRCRYSVSSVTILYGILMAVMGIEFFLALITSIYCCSGCCGSHSQGIIMQSYPPNQGVISNNINPVMPQAIACRPAPPYYFQQPGDTVAYSMQETDRAGLIKNAVPNPSDPPAQNMYPYSQSNVIGN